LVVLANLPLRTEVPSVSEANDFITEATGLDLAVDTETTGLLIRDGRDYTQGVSVSFRSPATRELKSFYFPFRHKYGTNYPDTTLYRLQSLIETAPTVTMHNAKFDLVALRNLGINVRTGSWICTAIWAHLINENYPYSKSLDDCAKHYLKGTELKEKPAELAAITDAKGLGWGYVPSHLMFDYACQDTKVTYLLREALWPLFKQEELNEYWPHKARLVEVVIEMESRGIGVNVELVKRLIDSSEQAIQDYQELLGCDPGKPAQLADLLLNRMGLPVVKSSPKTGKPSFDKEAMGVYDQILEQRNSPEAKYIKAYRGWKHARGLFYVPYLELRSPDGKLRPSYKHHKDADEGGTVTGRLSCQDPNLQQIPRVSNKEWNGRVKECFEASEGYELWEADYSQLELRLGTAYAKEPDLIQVFEEDRDIFTEMSKTLGWERQQTKGFVYSVQYGAGAKRIATVFGVTEAAAKGLIDRYYLTYPRFRAVSEAAKERVWSTRKIRLWSGRYRHFRNPKEENHKAFNSLIQGGAADIVERIMILLFDTVDQKSNGEVRMLLQVHDSVIFEIKKGTQDKWLPIIQSTMASINENVMDFGVKFAVDVHRFGKG